MGCFDICGQWQSALCLVMLAYLAYSLVQFWSRGGATLRMLVGLIVGTCFNPYVFELLARDPLDSLQQLSWSIFIIKNALVQNGSAHYIWLGICSAINPSNSLYFILNLSRVSWRGITAIFLLGVALGSIALYFSLKLSLQSYYQLYFPSSFEPQFNLLWMLYAHMFTRFLRLYQILFVIIQTSAVYLIGTLRFSHQFKMVLLTYFKVYCTYQCSQLCVVLALGVSFCFLYGEVKEIISGWGRVKQEGEVIKVKVLTLIIIIANVAFLPLDKILLAKYLSDFSLNIGYLFLFFGFPWIMNSIYLAELAININDFHQKYSNPPLPQSEESCSTGSPSTAMTHSSQ